MFKDLRYASTFSDVCEIPESTSIKCPLLSITMASPCQHKWYAFSFALLWQKHNCQNAKHKRARNAINFVPKLILFFIIKPCPF